MAQSKEIPQQPSELVLCSDNLKAQGFSEDQVLNLEEMHERLKGFHGQAYEFFTSKEIEDLLFLDWRIANGMCLEFDESYDEPKGPSIPTWEEMKLHYDHLNLL